MTYFILASDPARGATKHVMTRRYKDCTFAKAKSNCEVLVERSRCLKRRKIHNNFLCCCYSRFLACRLGVSLPLANVAFVMPKVSLQQHHGEWRAFFYTMPRGAKKHILTCWHEDCMPQQLDDRFLDLCCVEILLVIFTHVGQFRSHFVFRAALCSHFIRQVSFSYKYLRCRYCRIRWQFSSRKRRLCQILWQVACASPQRRPTSARS